jgi:hypothetical protein
LDLLQALFFADLHLADWIAVAVLFCAHIWIFLLQFFEKKDSLDRSALVERVFGLIRAPTRFKQEEEETVAAAAAKARGTELGEREVAERGAEDSHHQFPFPKDLEQHPASILGVGYNRVFMSEEERSWQQLRFCEIWFLGLASSN